MLKRNYCGEEEICCENGQTAKLYYYLLSEKCDNCDSYGAEIAMERDGVWESAAVRHVTTSSARMQTMIELLQRNTVTPCALHDIMLEELNKY